MSFAILIIFFIAGLSFSMLNYIFKNYGKIKWFNIIILGGICLVVSFWDGTDLFRTSIIEENNSALTISVDDDLVQDYKSKLAEDEKKEERRFYINNAVDLIKSIIFYILGLFSPFISKGIKKFLHKRKRRKKKRKRKIQDENKKEIMV